MHIVSLLSEIVLFFIVFLINLGLNLFFDQQVYLQLKLKYSHLKSYELITPQKIVLKLD